MDSVYDRISSVLVGKLKVEEGKVTEEASLVEDLGLDSLDLAELVMKLEEEFPINGEHMEISDEAAGELHTVKDVVVYIERRLAEETAVA